MGQLIVIGDENDLQRQIDRACAAQSPEMLPTTPQQMNDIEAAKERIRKFKEEAEKAKQSGF